jgi:hypothetical protein
MKFVEQISFCRFSLSLAHAGHLLHLLTLMDAHYADHRQRCRVRHVSVYASHTPEIFFSLLCHGTLATTLLMSELVISAAKHKIYYSYGVHLQSHRILIGWRNHFSQLLVVPGVIDV